MRALMLGMAVVAGMAAGSGQASADPFGIWSPPSWRTWYPWCAQLNIGFDRTECVYSNLEQCLETVRGVGGSCGPNPYPQPPKPAPVRSKRRHTR